MVCNDERLPDLITWGHMGVSNAPNGTPELGRCWSGRDTVVFFSAHDIAPYISRLAIPITLTTCDYAVLVATTYSVL